MFHLISVSFFAIVGFLSLLIERLLNPLTTYVEPTLPIVIASLAFIAMAINLVAMVFYNLITYNSHLESFEQLRNELIRLKQSKERYASLQIEIKKFLSEVYPQHEEKIFTLLTTNVKDLIATHFPEIKTIDGFISLSQRIESYSAKIDEREKDVQYTSKLIRQNATDKWMLTTPVVPHDLHPIVYQTYTSNEK